MNKIKKIIGFYSKLNQKKDKNTYENKNNDNYNKKGIIILIIAIGLLIINVIIFGIYLWNKKNGKNKRKRANELIDENYEYISDNLDNNKIINDH